MSTTVELVRANERYARLRAAVGALADEIGDTPHVRGCEGEITCLACVRLDLRASLRDIE